MKLAQGCSLILLCGGIIGCGPTTATIDGKITFNGEPVSRGMINFEPLDGKGSVAGGSVENGSFHIENVVPGEKIVRIMAVYTKGLEKESDGSEIEICDDLLPKSWGQDSKERVVVNPPKMDLTYEIEGPDPRKR